MEPLVQLLTELPVGTQGTNVDGHLPTTIGLQSAMLSHLVKASPSNVSHSLRQPIKVPPPITTCVSLATTGQTTIPSQLPGMVKGQSSSYLSGAPRQSA